MQYVGQTGRALKTRFKEHKYNCTINKKLRHYVYQHFRQADHSIKNLTIQPVELLTFNSTDSNSFKIKARHIAELKWIKRLQTPFPLGLNDNIYQQGNISKDPSIDIFDICSIRKRKSRSHGVRKNHNIIRKSRQLISLSDLNSILRRSGRHTMLSVLTSLSITSLSRLDEVADNIVVRQHPLYNIASLVQSYTQHILRPHIDDVNDHKRHFFKITFLNKGIDFIDLQSIFNDSKVKHSIPKYFKNTENPIICYKYKKPIRNIIFNYNKTVSDLDIISNTPTTCECSQSKFCYAPSGHIISGNFDIITDKRIRNLFTKGPKYRLPSFIDFDKCKLEIAESLEKFCKQWCGREGADSNSLSAWKKQILNIIDTRIKFYDANPSLLPPRPKLSINFLRKGIKSFHDKFVLVPADKAANNIIIV